jgi:hypothetical protein
MRPGQRLEFRKLRIETRTQFERKDGRGGFYTVHVYTFRDREGREYNYSGSNFKLGLPGSHISMSATVANISANSGRKIHYLKRPAILGETLDQFALIL